MNFKDLKNISIDELSKEYRRMSREVFNETKGRLRSTVFLYNKNVSYVSAPGDKKNNMIMVLCTIAEMEFVTVSQQAIFADLIKDMVEDMDL